MSTHLASPCRNEASPDGTLYGAGLPGLALAESLAALGHGSAESAGSLAESPAVRQQLRAIAARLQRDPNLRDDFFQEACLHLWKQEKAHPGQTLSWYLQSCRFRLQHLSAAGRSLDSPKRARMRMPCLSNLNGADDDSTPEELPDVRDAMAEISARDLLESLRLLLKPREKYILELFLQGWGTREISKRLRLSSKTVVDCRKTLASLGEKLGNYK